MAQDPDFIARFRDYNDYLDSLIAEEDIRYLQDGELARFRNVEKDKDQTYLTSEFKMIAFQAYC